MAGVAAGKEGYQYISLDNDPQFAVQGLDQFAGQWVEIAFELDVHFSSAHQAILYVDVGAGYNDQDAYRLALPDPQCKLSKTILKLPTTINSARLDPIAEEKLFSMRSLEVTALKGHAAYIKMLQFIAAKGLGDEVTQALLGSWRTNRLGDVFRAFRKQVYAAYGRACAVQIRSYALWLSYFEVQPAFYDVLKEKQRHWKTLPLISIAMPVFNAEPEFLEQAIESVRNQVYPHWELCIADDASTHDASKSVLEAFAKKDARIKVVFREKNGHISAATNSALALCSGVYVGFLDHDDLLHPLALHYVAEAANLHPDGALFYTDEDRIDTKNVRTAPYFKCEFNYELLLAQNMINHLSCFKRAAVVEVGGCRLGLEGSQDYDLVLRVIETIDPSQIVHIPRVLYHWRAVDGSTAFSADAKPYATVAAQRAIREHLERMGLSAEVSEAPGLPTWNKVVFMPPQNNPRVCIIIPTRDRVDLLSVCLASIAEKTTYPNYRIVVIDNNSVEPETLRFLENVYPDVVSVIKDDRPFNYSALNNSAVDTSEAEYVCLMNNDIEVLSPGWLEEMLGHASRQGIGAVGARLWYPDGRLQHGGLVIGIGGSAGHSHKYLPRGNSGYFGRAALPQAMSGVTAAVLLIRKTIYQEVGGLEETLQVAFNDVDFCLKVEQKGYRNVWTPYAEFIHHESATRGYETTPEKQLRMDAEKALLRQRWGRRLSFDPYYSPNLTQEHEDFSLAWPPRLDSAVVDFAPSPAGGRGLG